MPAPVTTCARANTASSEPSKPVACSASTSHASVAPEKNVKPSPIRAEEIAQAQNGPWTYHSMTYSTVVTANVTVPSRNDSRRPHESATMPVGTSNSTMPAVKNALAANASKLFSPASSRKIVFTPQISDAARVLPNPRT